MKAKISDKNKRLIEIYCLNYAITYLRCIIAQAQIEQMILLHAEDGKNVFISNKLLRLNLKHNKLVKNLFDKKNKLKNCA